MTDFHEQCYAIKFCVLLKKNATAIYNDLKRAYGDSVMSHRTCNHWLHALERHECRSQPIRPWSSLFLLPGDGVHSHSSKTYYSLLQQRCEAIGKGSHPPKTKEPYLGNGSSITTMPGLMLLMLSPCSWHKKTSLQYPICLKVLTWLHATFSSIRQPKRILRDICLTVRP